MILQNGMPRSSSLTKSTKSWMISYTEETPTTGAMFSPGSVLGIASAAWIRGTSFHLRQDRCTLFTN